VLIAMNGLSPNFEKLKDRYNIKNYNLEKYKIADMRGFHRDIIEKYYL
jgi:hypothetical protein